MFFAMAAFSITCTVMLFAETLSKDLNIALTAENLNRAAKLTFLNVIFLSVLFTVIDTVRRKLTVEKITKRIADAAKALVNGNFNVSIPREGNFAVDENYNKIIDCFNKTAKELSGVETLRNDFIADVSHEIKTPLTVIQNYGTLLQTSHLSEQDRLIYAEGIVEASRQMSDMITNILKLNRLENQQIYLNISTFDLGEQLRQAILNFESIWEEKNIKIEMESEEALTVVTDAELLSLVWNNLLSNALKFTESGGTVSVKLISDSDYATVKIKDTGCGMTAEVGQHIFEKFYQGDTSHKTQGNGLGLALVKRVTDILKGEISVESIVGVGSEFTVKIRRKYYEH